MKSTIITGVGGCHCDLSALESRIARLEPVVLKLPIPSQKGTLTYQYHCIESESNPQTPEWNDYDESLMTIGGVTEAIKAGTYRATFTANDGYHFANGETFVNVSWIIDKAMPTFSLEKNEVRLCTRPGIYGSLTGYIYILNANLRLYERSGSTVVAYGVLTSSNSEMIHAGFNVYGGAINPECTYGEVLEIQGTEGYNGIETITLTVPESNNYYALGHDEVITVHCSTE